MHATPNQHLLTLPSSPVGKSSDLHCWSTVVQIPLRAQVFFLYTYYPVATHSPITDIFFLLSV